MGVIEIIRAVDVWNEQEKGADVVKKVNIYKKFGGGDITTHAGYRLILN